MPWLWPALFSAVVMAWMQALMWMPYGLRGIRVVISVLWLLAIDVVVFVAVDLHATDATIVALLAPQLPIAYVIARYGVARARRGEIPDWSLGFRNEREGSAEAAEGVGEGDVVPEPLDQGSGESMDSAEKSAQN